jgi:hypothetical protein
MTMIITDIRIVDMRYSELDLPSDPEKAKITKAHMEKTGEYKFKDGKKVYVNFYDKGRRPPYWFTWCRYSDKNNYMDLYEWRMTWGYTPVNRDEDPFWPEPTAPNPEGHYVVGDVILVKVNLIDHLKRRLEEQSMSSRGARAKLQQFNSAMKRAKGALPDDMLEKLMGDLPGKGIVEEGEIPAL